MTSSLILSTRPDGDQDPLLPALRAAAFRAEAVPTVALEPVAPGGPLDRAVRDASTWDWVVVTSRRGVDAVATTARHLTPDSPVRSWRARWAAVGDGTAEALRREGVLDVLVPAQRLGAAIADELARESDLLGRRILLPRASGAGPELPQRLTALGAIVDDVVAYRTVIGPLASARRLAAALDDADLAAAVVASGSAVTGLVDLAERSGRESAQRVRHLPLVSIGPSTSAAVTRLGLQLAAEADAPTIDALVSAVQHAVATRPIATGAAR